MALLPDLLSAGFLSFAIFAVVWPSLVILGGYADDEDNWVGLLFLGFFILVWVFYI